MTKSYGEGFVENDKNVTSSSKAAVFLCKSVDLAKNNCGFVKDRELSNKLSFIILLLVCYNLVLFVITVVSTDLILIFNKAILSLLLSTICIYFIVLDIIAKFTDVKCQNQNIKHHDKIFVLDQLRTSFRCLEKIEFLINYESENDIPKFSEICKNIEFCVYLRNKLLASDAIYRYQGDLFNTALESVVEKLFPDALLQHVIEMIFLYFSVDESVQNQRLYFKEISEFDFDKFDAAKSEHVSKLRSYLDFVNNVLLGIERFISQEGDFASINARQNSCPKYLLTDLLSAESIVLERLKQRMLKNQTKLYQYLGFAEHERAGVHTQVFKASYEGFKYKVDNDYDHESGVINKIQSCELILPNEALLQEGSLFPQDPLPDTQLQNADIEISKENQSYRKVS